MNPHKTSTRQRFGHRTATAAEQTACHAGMFRVQPRSTRSGPGGEGPVSGLGRPPQCRRSITRRSEVARPGVRFRRPGIGSSRVYTAAVTATRQTRSGNALPERCAVKLMDRILACAIRCHRGVGCTAPVRVPRLRARCEPSAGAQPPGLGTAFGARRRESFGGCPARHRLPIRLGHIAKLYVRSTSFGVAIVLTHGRHEPPGRARVVGRSRVLSTCRSWSGQLAWSDRGPHVGRRRGAVVSMYYMS